MNSPLQNPVSPYRAYILNTFICNKCRRKYNTNAHKHFRCASGCVVECRICNREVAGSNLGRGYFAPRSTQPSIPLGSVSEYQVWLIPIADERVGVQVKLWNPLRTHAIPEHFCGGIHHEEVLYQVYAPLHKNKHKVKKEIYIYKIRR